MSLFGRRRGEVLCGFSEKSLHFLFYSLFLRERVEEDLGMYVRFQTEKKGNLPFSCWLALREDILFFVFCLFLSFFLKRESGGTAVWSLWALPLSKDPLVLLRETSSSPFFCPIFQNRKMISNHFQLSMWTLPMDG